MGGVSAELAGQASVANAGLTAAQVSGLHTNCRNATSSWGGALTVGQGASLRYHMVRGGEREMLLPPRDPPPASASVTNSWARVGL